MSGYDDEAFENEDWLISPEFNANLYQNTVLSFDNTSGYYHNDLELYYSENYSGSGNPNNADWTQITGFNLSTEENWEWQSSGNIDLSDIQGESVYLGFKYISSDSYATTWEVDNILLTANITSSTNPDAIQKQLNASCYPVPFSNELHIDYYTNNNSNAVIEIYDISGKQIVNTDIKNNYKSSFIWTGQNAAGQTVNPGFYFIKITTKDGVQILKTMKTD